MDISVTGTADLEDLDITTIGINTEIRMTSASTQDDAIDIESDGGIDITAAGIMDITSDGVMNITSDGVMNITTSAAASNITVDPNGAGTLALGTADNTAVTAEALAVTLTAGNALTTTSNTFSITSDDGNSELKANAENAVLNVAAIGGGATQELQLFSEGTGASGIHIKTSGATGGIIIDASSQGGHAASDDVVIKASNFDVDGAGAVVAASTITATEFIGNMQSNQLESDEVMTIKSTNTAAAALKIETTVGGMHITTAGDAAGDDLDISTTTATTEMRLTSASEEDDAIELKATAGGILARVADTKTLVLGNNPASTADTYVKVAPSSVPGNEKIEILNTAGTADDAIALKAVAGGILGRVANGKDLVLGDISGAGSDSYFKLSASGTGNLEKIEIKNNTGGSQVDAIKLLAVDGGITIDAGGGDAATDDVVIVGKNFSVTDAGVMAVEGAITAASFSGTMVTSSLSPAINEALTISTTTNNVDADDHITFNSVDNVAINAEGDISLDADGDITLDAAGNNITMKVNGANKLDILDASGDVVIQSMTNDKDMVFKQFNGTEILSLNHNGSATFAAALNTATFDATGAVDLASASGITTIGSSNALTVAADGVLTVNNTTDASSSTTGSTIIDGGVGIAMKLYVGTNLDVTGTTLLAGETTVNTGIIPDADGAYIGAAAKPFGNVFVGDGSVLNFGDNQDVQLTHHHDSGLLLNSTNKIYFEDGSSYDQYIGRKLQLVV